MTRGPRFCAMARVHSCQPLVLTHSVLCQLARQTNTNTIHVVLITLFPTIFSLHHSNWGTCVDVVAPGSKLSSTFPAAPGLPLTPGDWWPECVENLYCTGGGMMMMPVWRSRLALKGSNGPVPAWDELQQARRLRGISSSSTDFRLVLTTLKKLAGNGLSAGFVSGTAALLLSSIPGNVPHHQDTTAWVYETLKSTATPGALSFGNVADPSVQAATPNRLLFTLSPEPGTCKH